MQEVRKQIEDIQVGDWVRVRGDTSLSSNYNAQVVEVGDVGFTVVDNQQVLFMRWSDYLFHFIPEEAFDVWWLKEGQYIYWSGASRNTVREAWRAARKATTTTEALAVAVLEGDKAALPALVDLLMEEGMLPSQTPCQKPPEGGHLLTAVIGLCEKLQAIRQV